MYETICQKCGASNRTDAVVCSQCGTRLEHRERRVGARLAASGVPRMILTAPVRFAAWLGKKGWFLLKVLFFLLVIGGSLLFFLLFVPLSWPDYPMPQPERDARKTQRDLAVLSGVGGAVRCNTGELRTLGNLLIFEPERGGRMMLGRRTGKNAVKRTADREKGYFSAIKEGDNRFIFALYMRWRGKLPMRLALEYEALRDKDGVLVLQSCKFGNLFVPRTLFRRAAEKMLGEWNPRQRLLTVFDRLEKGCMELRSNSREETLVLTVRPDDPAASRRRLR